jgi:hypothetical protein
MDADDASMQLQLPIKRKQGSLWDPDAEPFGPKAVFTVREMGEVEFLQRQNNFGVAGERIDRAERRAERLSGVNDAVGGVSSQEKRTATEVNIFSEQSLGRVSEVVKNFQETLEEVYQVRHVMWKRALADMGAEGMQAPPSVAQNIRQRMMPAPAMPQAPDARPSLVPPQAGFGLDARAPNVADALPDVRFTVQMMEGAFRFKPRGSVENADKNRQRFDWNQWLIAMSNVARVNPMVMAVMGTPQAAKALIEQSIRLYNVQDKQAFLGSEAMAAMQQMMQMQMMSQMMGGAPGGPPQGGGGQPPAPPISPQKQPGAPA